MKAQHRKELQTNSLADSFGRLIQSFKSDSSNSVYLVCLLALAAAALFFGVRHFYKKSEQKTARLWVQLTTATKTTELKEIASKNPGTTQASIARLEEARTLLREGEPRLYSAFERAQGRKDLEEARSLYGPLVKEFRDMPILAQESLLALAKINENLGDYDKAWEHYKQLAQQFPATSAGKEARAILGDDLENKSQQWLDRVGWQKQYAQLAEARQKKVPPPPTSIESKPPWWPEGTDKKLPDDSMPGVSAPK